MLVNGPGGRIGPSITLAVIMTCHNRRDLTVECVRRALSQTTTWPVEVTFVVTDDGSTDGTADAIGKLSDRVKVIHGSGELHWAGGMALAEGVASKLPRDYLLWLNDDTFLDHDALQVLLDASAANPDAIVVGATREEETSAVTYGARRRSSKWHPQRFELLPESSVVQRADTFNGNIVLVPSSVHARVGTIDAEFPHAYADDDYGLRATAVGVPVLQAPGTLGVCAPNPGDGPVRGVTAWRAAQNPKGLPWRAQLRFFKRHGGIWWPLTFVAQQTRMLMPHRPLLRSVSKPGQADRG